VAWAPFWRSVRLNSRGAYQIRPAFLGFPLPKAQRPGIHQILRLDRSQCARSHNLGAGGGFREIIGVLPREPGWKRWPDFNLQKSWPTRGRQSPESDWRSVVGELFLSCGPDEGKGGLLVAVGIGGAHQHTIAADEALRHQHIKTLSLAIENPVLGKDLQPVFSIGAEG